MSSRGHWLPTHPLKPGAFIWAGMKFLVDAHLPASPGVVLSRRGHHTVHTLDLPDKN